MTEENNFDHFLRTLENKLLAIARAQVSDHVDALVGDGRDFVRETERDLRERAALLANGEMTPAGFALAVRGKADLAKMNALERAGLAAVQVDKLKRSLIDAVVETATTLFLPKV